MIDSPAVTFAQEVYVDFLRLRIEWRVIVMDRIVCYATIGLSGLFCPPNSSHTTHTINQTSNNISSYRNFSDFCSNNCSSESLPSRKIKECNAWVLQAGIIINHWNNSVFLNARSYSTDSFVRPILLVRLKWNCWYECIVRMTTNHANNWAGKL